MTLPVLVILGVLWAVVLVPPLLRSRSQRSADSIVDFNYQLDVLGRTNGNLDGSSAPATDKRARATGEETPASALQAATAQRTALDLGLRAAAARRSAKRRRDVLRGLALSVVVTFLLASGTRSGAVWSLQILVDVVAATYLALWAWVRSVRAERAGKVRYMPELRVPELALRRSASS